MRYRLLEDLLQLFVERELVLAYAFTLPRVNIDERHFEFFFAFCFLLIVLVIAKKAVWLGSNFRLLVLGVLYRIFSEVVVDVDLMEPAFFIRSLIDHLVFSIVTLP